MNLRDIRLTNHLGCLTDLGPPQLQQNPCCRSCLEEWHGIHCSLVLNEQERLYVFATLE